MKNKILIFLMVITSLFLQSLNAATTALSYNTTTGNILNPIPLSFFSMTATNVKVGSNEPSFRAPLDVDGGFWIGGGNGDINHSGNITALDLALIQRWILGTGTNPPNELAIADINGDGLVNTLDLTLLQRVILGKTTLDVAKFEGKRIAAQTISPYFNGVLSINVGHGTADVSGNTYPDSEVTIYRNTNTTALLSLIGTNAVGTNTEVFRVRNTGEVIIKGVSLDTNIVQIVLDVLAGFTNFDEITVSIINNTTFGGTNTQFTVNANQPQMWLTNFASAALAIDLATNVSTVINIGASCPGAVTLTAINGSGTTNRVRGQAQLLLNNDNGPSVDWTFSGITTFGNITNNVITVGVGQKVMVNIYDFGLSRSAVVNIVQ